jgi:parvulin-like peptidyl-prolyl isomerase
MFSSLLIGLLTACNPPAEPYIPGVLETDGKLIATVNGVEIKDGIVDSLLKDVPEAQRAMIIAGPQFAQLKEQLVTTEVLYQEAIKANIQSDADAQLMMHLTEREVLTDFLVKKLAKAKLTDAKLQEWYDEHLVQFRKDSADLSMIAVDDEATANAASAELKSGVAFADVAGKYSTDPRTKATGGSLGNMDLSGLPPQIVQAVDSIPAGETLSGPVDMGQGFMILKVENRQQTVTPFEEVKEQIQESALKETAQEVVKELREKATVEFPAEATTETPAIVTPTVTKEAETTAPAEKSEANTEAK